MLVLVNLNQCGKKVKKRAEISRITYNFITNNIIQPNMQDTNYINKRKKIHSSNITKTADLIQPNKLNYFINNVVTNPTDNAQEIRKYMTLDTEVWRSRIRVVG